MMLTTSLMLCR